MQPPHEGLRARWERALDRADQSLATGRRWPLIILAGALILKLVFVVRSADALYIRVPLMDACDYDRVGQEIARGKLLRNEAFFYGPLYSYFLGLVYSLVGRDLMVVRVLQAMGGATTATLAFLIGRRVFRPSAALLGAALLALYGAMTFYETELLMEWMGALLDCTALWLLVTAHANSSARRYAAAGAALGFSALARANVLLFAVFVLAWIARDAHPARRLRALAFAAGLVASLLPAMIHNAVVSGVWVPVTSNGGLNFYIGNSRHANGKFGPVADVDLYNDFTTREYLQRKSGRDMDPAEVSSYWFARSFDDIRAAPGHALALTAKKVAMFFNGYEIPQIDSFDVQAREFAWLRVLFVRLWFIMVFGLLGLFLCFRAGGKQVLLSGFVWMYAASIALFFVTGRYRAQAAPILCLFAGYAIVTIPSRITSLRSGAACAVAAIALVAATSPSIFASDPVLITFGEQIHRARRLSEIGSYQPALREVDKAIAIYPDQAEGYLQRAIVHREAKNDFKAIEDYRHALKINDRLPGTHYDLAQSLRRVNLREQAVAEYRHAAELDPSMAQAFSNMGVTLREMGHTGDAIQAFRQAIEAAPRYRKAYNNLGASYAEAGRLGDAVSTFEETTRLFPDYANAYKNLAMAYAAQRRPRPALQAMRRYAQLNPGDPEAAEAIRKLEIAARADTTSAGN